MKTSFISKWLSRHRRQGVILLLLLLSSCFTGCMRLKYISPETPPAERFFLGAKSWYDDSHLLPWPYLGPLTYIFVPPYLCLLPVELAGDIIALPYDVYVSHSCLVSPNINYCIRFNKNDRLAKILDHGGDPLDGGTGPYHSSLSPEETARKYNNMRGLSLLLKHGLPMSEETATYIFDMTKFKSIEFKDAISELEIRSELLKTIAEYKADYFLQQEKYRNMAFHWFIFIQRKLRKESDGSHKNTPEAIAYREAASRILLSTMDFLLSHGFSPNIPTVERIYYRWQPGLYNDGRMRMTLLDYVQEAADIHEDLRKPLIEILLKHGALTYRQLVENNPQLPHLHLENVEISPSYQPVIDILQHSRHAECYRLSNSHPGIDGPLLVIEAGIRDEKNNDFVFSQDVQVPVHGTQIFHSVNIPVNFRIILSPETDVPEHSLRAGYDFPEKILYEKIIKMPDYTMYFQIALQRGQKIYEDFNDDLMLIMRIADYHKAYKGFYRLSIDTLYYPSDDERLRQRLRDKEDREWRKTH